MENGDGHTVGDVETGTADTEGFNAPLTNRGRFPTHVIEQQLRCYVLNIPGVDIYLKPSQFVRRDSIVVGIKEFG